MKHAISRSVVLLLVALTAAQAAGPTLAKVFSDHMVLPCATPVPIWGTATPGEEITVEFAGQKKSTKADTDGKWLVRLAPLSANATPQSLRVSQVTLQNILIGDVWLFSGQSNMVMSLKKGPWCSYGGVVNGEQEVAAAADNQIRVWQEKPGAWELCCPENAQRFSAVAYFFGRKLRAELNVPVGLIVAAAGGQPAEYFIPERTVQGDASLAAERINARQVMAELGAKGDADQKAWREFAHPAPGATRPAKLAPKLLTREQTDAYNLSRIILNYGFIYKRSIQPLVPFPVKGCVWYQGESNATRGEAYAPLLATLIKGWREDWGRPLPFVVIALAGFSKPEAMDAKGASFPLVREAVGKVSETVSDVGVVSAVDLGEAGNIHPANKKPVGERAAGWVLNHVYGRKMVAAGPGFGKVTFRDGEAEVLLTSDREGATLKTPGGFELAGEDRKFCPAKATLTGEVLVVKAPAISRPVALRYAFQNFPECTVYNGAGLPALPFRTDSWPIKASAVTPTGDGRSQPDGLPAQ